MRFPRMALLGCLAFLGLFVGAGEAEAAAVPVIQGTQEVGIPAGGGRMLLVYGQNLTKVTSWELDDAGGTLISPLTVVFKGKTLTGLALPASLVPPTYTLPGNFSLKYSTKTASASVLVKLSGGRIEDGAVANASLDPALRTDLDDAITVGGESLTELHSAGLLVGSLSVDSFSAYDDLIVEAKVGSGASQVAAGSHDHDPRYPLRTELNTTGTINNAGNPVQWSRLVGVPASLADGVDDTGATAFTAGTGLTLVGTTFSVNFAGNGSAATASKSDHNHDSAYYTQAQLNATGGAINAGTNPVDWSRLKGVPAAFADGVDDAGSNYSNGPGLLLASNTFAVDFGGDGSEDTVSRTDHTHSGYLNLAGGDTISGLTIINSSTDAIIATTGNTSSGTTGSVAGGIDSTSAAGIGVAGHGNIGVLGDLDSDGTWGVAGRAGYSNQVGVYAYANSGNGDSSSTALHAYHYWNGVGVKAVSYSGIGLQALSYSGPAAYAAAASSYATVMQVYGSYGSRGIDVRVQYNGTGIYSYAGSNGKGLQTYVGSNGTGVYIRTGSYGVGVDARTGNYGTAVRGYSYLGTGAALTVRGKNATGLLVDSAYTSTLAVFQYYGSNVARINFKGIGYFNGGTYTGGADFAESVRVDQPVEEFEPGDVMVIDPKAPRQFALSRESNSPLVAGVISTKPALVGSLHDVAGGRNAKMRREEVKLGIVGIVPTKVCDEGGAIAIGDLLVSASMPGHARKAPANPAVGTVIGKALGALDRGTSKIEVLLMAR